VLNVHPLGVPLPVRGLPVGAAALAPGQVLRARYPLAQAERAVRAAPRTAGKTWIALPG
jgi:hypothetical protein